MALTKIQSHNIDTLDTVAIGGLIANGSVGTDGQGLVSNGSVAYWSDVVGEKGSKGDTGDKGVKGESYGPKGQKGETGATGPVSTYDVTLNTFTGNGSNTEFTLSSTPTDENHVLVTVYGVVQHKSTYSITSDTLTFSEAPPSSAPVEVVVFTGGAKGEKGIPGEYAGKGDKGDVGPAGDKGDKGNTGDVEAQGNKGDKGDGTMVYPSGNGVPVVSNGSAWGTTVTAPSSDIVGISDSQTLTNKTVTGLATGSSIKDSDGTSYTIGYRHAPQNAKSTGYTLVNSDSGKHIYYTGAANTITIPVDGATTGGDFEIGTIINVINNGTANINLAIASGGSLYYAGTTSTGTRVLQLKAISTAMKVAGNTWFVSGSGLV